MKKFVLLVFLLCPAVVYSAETEPPPTKTEEPKLYDHYLSLKRMQESLAARSLEEQTRLQPQIQRAEQQPGHHGQPSFLRELRAFYRLTRNEKVQRIRAVH